MLVHWGTRESRRGLGFVADYCPICGAVTAQRLFERRAYRHVNFIPVSRGKLERYERECVDCGTEDAIFPSPYAYAERRIAAVDELIAKTFPDIRAYRGDLMNIEDRRRSRKLARDERRQLVQAAFKEMERYLARRKIGQNIDPWTGFAAIVTVILIFVAFGVVIAALEPAKQRAPDPSRYNAAIVSVAMVAIGVAVTTYLGLTLRRRVVNRVVLPRLGRALLRLDPSDVELEALLTQPPLAGGRLSSVVSVTALRAAIERMRRIQAATSIT